VKVDADQTKLPAPNKHHNTPSIPADAICEGGNVDEYATHVYANLTKTAYIDPQDWIDLLTRAFNDILPPVSAYAPGLKTPRHKEKERMSSRDEYRHLACYGVYSIAVDAALETAMPTICSTTATAAEKAHARDVHDAAVRAHKVVTEAVESRRAYVRRSRAKSPSLEERVVYSRFFDTQAADRNTNGVDGLLAALEDNRIEVSLHAAAKAQAAQKEKLVLQFDGDE
jgi:hypothetical protein